MEAIGYIRVSTDEQARNGVSLDTQRVSIEVWTGTAGIPLKGILEDAGISGTGIRQRPGLQQALELACEHKAVLVVYSLSRLSRSTKDTLQIAERLDKAGADLVSLSEKIDTTSATGKMIFRLMAVLNEFERDQVSERTALALRHKRDCGLVYSPVPYGYDRVGDRLVPFDKEQEILEMMRDLRRQGRSYRFIADYMTRQGIPTKNGGRWHPATVRAMLRR